MHNVVHNNNNNNNNNNNISFVCQWFHLSLLWEGIDYSQLWIPACVWSSAASRVATLSSRMCHRSYETYGFNCNSIEADGLRRLIRKFPVSDVTYVTLAVLTLPWQSWRPAMDPVICTFADMCTSDRRACTLRMCNVDLWSFSASETDQAVRFRLVVLKCTVCTRPVSP